jgi:hypothetical protein
VALSQYSEGKLAKMILQSLTEHILQKFPWLIDTFSLEPQQIVSHDRVILEQVILPTFANATTIQKLLFVGCAAYTQRYKDIFINKEYWTIDPKRVKKKYGSERHIVDSIIKIETYIKKGYFDVIIMNGVIGFGLNLIGDIEQAINACYATLARQGILLVGWNDTDRRIPTDIRAIHALGKFRPYHFEPLQTCHYRTEGWQRHTLSFYQKA